MDGARFSNSLCSLNVKPDEMNWKLGLDCLTVVKKKWCIWFEAIIFFNKKICNYKFFQKEVVML